jgi:hypothetical protein
MSENESSAFDLLKQVEAGPDLFVVQDMLSEENKTAEFLLTQEQPHKTKRSSIVDFILRRGESSDSKNCKKRRKSIVEEIAASRKEESEAKLATLLTISPSHSVEIALTRMSFDQDLTKPSEKKDDIEISSSRVREPTKRSRRSSLSKLIISRSVKSPEPSTESPEPKS